VKAPDEGLIVLNHLPFGGITDYLHYQANALVEIGTRVLMVGVIGIEKRFDAKYEYLPFWTQPSQTKSTGIRRLTGRTINGISLVRNMRAFARFIDSRPERTVLLGGFLEYLAPLWVGPFVRISKQNKRFLTVIHDPVRDFVVGPAWWHRYSIHKAYSFIHTGFVHGDTKVVTDADGVHLVSIPIGRYPLPAANETCASMRTKLGIPSDATAILFFGHIRDGKNLDLLIRAVAKFPNMHLIVAGKEQSSGQRPSAYYRGLCEDLGIQDRCHFEVRFIKDEEIGAFFAAADLAALTYSSDFRSASSALSACIQYRVPCLASSGAGPLRDLVNEFELGLWVKPDDTEAIVIGLRNLLESPPKPQWEAYDETHSWNRNARIVRAAMLGSVE
jgi:glycosyltransferase involved in cell wall biosynthesis